MPCLPRRNARPDVKSAGRCARVPSSYNGTMNPSSSLLTVQDLLHGVPDLDRGDVRGQERWRRFTTQQWSEGWKAAALALGMFETSDFRSQQNAWHDENVRLGKASGPYQGNSRFRRWWSQPTPAVTTASSETSPSPETPSWVFDVWLVTDRSDRNVHGLLVFKRNAPTTLDLPEVPMDARCKPRFTVPVRVVGEASFWVRQDQRGKGLGTRMAQALVAAYQPGLEAAYQEAPFMPFMIAHDRGLRLLERYAPWPLVSQSNFNQGQRRDMLHEAVHRIEDWPQWDVPRIPLDAPARAPRRRPKP